MISISECINETTCAVGESCSNNLVIYHDPATIFTNRTSFVGVKAIVRAECNCNALNILNFEKCLNGGTYDKEKHECICPNDFGGPNCEALDVSFNGNGWAMYSSFHACNRTELTLEISTNKRDGLIFYIGPLSVQPIPFVQGNYNLYNLL